MKQKRRDFIAEYREWAENRYNPGYWLGGKTPPSIGNMWSVKDRRWLGLIFTSAGVGGLIFTWRHARDFEILLVPVVMLGLMVAFGLLLLFSRDRG